MMMGTHKILARNLINNVDEDKRFLIKDSHFVWGNIKPDCASKYKLKKHYLDESLGMIVGKIEFLASLNITDIYNKYSISMFNQELGVVCHFLCDYFCMPHSQRWEFKSANNMKEHIIYERNLAKVAKNFIITKDIDFRLSPEEIGKYILELQNEYQQGIHFERDLKYAYYISNSIINMILDKVIMNEKAKNNFSLVI